MTQYEHRKAEGLCVRCGRPAVGGRILCAECAAKNNASCKELYAWRKANGVCTGCGKEKAEPGVTRCWRCRLNMNAASAVWHEAKREEAISAGVCAWCGALVDDGRWLCGACRKKTTGIQQRTEEKMNVAYCIDCMEAMAKMPDKCFDLAVVDPPYGGGGHEFAGGTRFGGWFDRYKPDADESRLGGAV